jgi:hypothetical protein
MYELIFLRNYEKEELQGNDQQQEDKKRKVSDRFG